MPTRAAANGFIRLLRDAGPLYVVDPQRRIVYCNQACLDWLGCAAEDLLDGECRYHSSPEATGARALAAALCPPPEAFAGVASTEAVVPPGDDDGSRRRAVSFKPLAIEHDGAAVYAVVAIVGERVEASANAPTDSSASSGGELHRRLAEFRRALERRFHVDRLAGVSPAIRRVRAQTLLASEHRASVMVVGPAGSGREHVARAIHYGRPGSSAGPIVPLTCSILGPPLLESTARFLARAARGQSERPPTLLLIDVDDSPRDVRERLSALAASEAAHVRIVSTASRDLNDLAVAGRFPPELASQLSTMTIRLPPLAERAEDLPLAAQMFLEQHNAQGAKQLQGFTPEALDRLAAHAWPGDLDELAAAVAAAYARSDGPEIKLSDLPADLARGSAPAQRGAESIVLADLLAAVEREILERALRRAKGNKTKAARLLGMTRPRFYRRLVQLGLARE